MTMSHKDDENQYLVTRRCLPTTSQEISALDLTSCDDELEAKERVIQKLMLKQEETERYYQEHYEEIAQTHFTNYEREVKQHYDDLNQKYQDKYEEEVRQLRQSKQHYDDLKQNYQEELVKLKNLSIF